VDDSTEADNDFEIDEDKIMEMFEAEEEEEIDDPR
jgi:hypothetical protein